MFDTPKFQLMEYTGPAFPIWSCVGFAETFKEAQDLYWQHRKLTASCLTIQHYKGKANG